MDETTVASAPAWAERIVRLMDDGIRVPGTSLRFGLDPVIGVLLPGVGDALTAVPTLSLFGLALSRGVPRVVLLRMALNVSIDTALGALPVVGDAFDLGFKANRRNLTLIEAHAQSPAKRGSLADYLFVGAVLAAVVSVLMAPIVLTFWLLGALWSHAR